MQCRRPAHRPGVVVADVGDFVGQNADDLAARHAAQQPFGQNDRGASRAPQRVGIHVAWSRDAIEIGQSGQAGSAANLRQNVE